ncbi:hypothetical protein PR202_ga15864 [Eleusine coracana subsp. coracana]|uniref:Proteasome endopeptidase complex n=1 Tax=Eleusine coracana subsp. coracana TaxID=191504 RepID=A0AAV5CKI8_ELECO|nr:hypothetical protein PR202_ga15864 [Eleusine coracana subsp. coracana]
MDSAFTASSSAVGEAPTSGEHRMGTTIVGVCYNGGVILGADSRTSTGMYVANRASDKITSLTDNVYVCRSGSNMLQAGMIVGGWDKYEGGQIFSVPLGGTILKQSFAIGGSGSSYLYALLDHEWRDGMSQEEAEKFVVKAVSLAMARDGASGGVVRTVTINADGVTKNFYPGNKLPLWHEELEPHNSLLDILAGGSPDPMVQ